MKKGRSDNRPGMGPTSRQDQSQPPSTEPAAIPVSIPLRSEQGYTYDARFTITGVGESIESAQPGQKRLALEGSAKLTNTTTGRIAPVLSFEILVAIPMSGCASGLTCQEGFRLFRFAMAPEAAEVPAGGSIAYVVPQGGAYEQAADEVVGTESFCWGLRHLSGEDEDAIAGGWHPVGDPTFACPTFTVRDFSG